MEEIIQEYYQNNAKKLYGIVDKIVFSKGYGGIYDKDELYAIATDVFVSSIDKFNEDRGDFYNFLYSNISRKIITSIRDSNRSKRSNTRQIIDKAGKVNYEFLPDISIDAPVGESDLVIKDILKGEEQCELSGNAELYLESLSKTQKKIAFMIMENYSPLEIREKLNISDERYTRIFNDMKSFEKRIILEHDDSKFMEDKQLGNNNAQTLEKSKADRMSISSIIKKINNQKIRFNHPLQRPSDQWTSAMKGNLVSDILQGNPIPPLVFAEEVINGLAIIWDLDGKQRATNCYSFKNDGFKIAKNIRRWNIVYQTTIKDEDGKPILDANGFPQSERREFDIRGKKFSKLPEELKDRFLDYNFEITQYINCSKEDIAYHIARYNEGKPMSTSHKGIIRLGEEFASVVKSISAMPFFKEKGGYKVSEGNNGTIDRVVIESVMAANFLEDWKKDINEMCDYMKNNATSETFDTFEEMVDRITKFDNESVLSMFDSKDSFIYFGLYAKFVNTGLDDTKFVEFMAELSRSLHSKEVNGQTYDDLCFDKETGKARATKDKYIVIPKLELLEILMMDYLNIDRSKIQSDGNSILEFVRKNINADVTQNDIKTFEEDFELYALDVDNDSRLMDKKNRASFIALIAYAYKRDKRLDEWFVDYFNRIKTYIENQKQNYLHMIQDLEKYTSDKERLSA